MGEGELNRHRKKIIKIGRSENQIGQTDGWTWEIENRPVI